MACAPPRAEAAPAARSAATDSEASVAVAVEGPGWAAEAARRLRRHGFCVLTGGPGRGLAPAEVCERGAGAALERLGQLAGLWRQLGLDNSRDKVMFSEVCARRPGCRRYDVSLALAGLPADGPGPPGEAADPAWGELQGHIDRWARPVLRASGLLRPGCQDRAGCVVSEPGAPAQDFHQDGMEPGLVNAFMPLVPVVASNGPTEFRPGSHRSAWDLDSGSDGGCAADSDEERPAVAPEVGRGDLLLFDYRVFHRGLANCSAEPRPVAYIVYARHGLSDRHNFPDASLVEERIECWLVGPILAVLSVRTAGLDAHPFFASGCRA
ncbi:unnamed protein product [Prorocentrum cordatum]|uniref:Phytanoyl-CoA dioxygenase n=1 Tax=Prorocentrum cordatum TaxID=2364126 RepID=A0ABN9VZX4_9DINO|nr:unnamed protein product [Polarella glacialis]